jgi:hypothetical protein
MTAILTPSELLQQTMIQLEKEKQARTSQETPAQPQIETEVEIPVQPKADTEEIPEVAIGVTDEEIRQFTIDRMKVADQAAETMKPGLLTEKETIEIVKRWVVEDDEVELSERRTFEEMVEELQCAGEIRTTDLSVSQFKKIIQTFAPNAPNAPNAKDVQSASKVPPYPDELAPLIASGIALYEDGFWLVSRCEKCGQFKNKCCGRVLLNSAVRQDGKTLTAFGRQAVGLDPIKPPKPPKTLEEIKQERQRNLDKSPWWGSFRGVDELEGNGTVKMYIENFLPEGATLICGLPKVGKSFLALSVAKALTSGQPLFGRLGFEVPEVVPVLYLAAESGDGALKLRCEKMGITKDKTKFICRTLSQGLMLGLDDPQIESLIRDMKPIVILETLIRFNDGKDEDDATENRKLAHAIFRLIALGARAVLGIHHSRKDLNKTNPTKEAAVRGSGDGLAMVDAVWLVMQDERLYQRGKGPNEIDVVGWGRDFNPVPMRLGLTKKAPKDLPNIKMFAPGIVSNINSGGDLEWVNKGTFESRGLEQRIEQLVTENPAITKPALAEQAGISEWEVRNILKALGYHRKKGGKKGATRWMKEPGKVDSPTIG